MPVTFGVHGMPSDAGGRTSGVEMLAARDRVADAMGPLFTTMWVSDHLQQGAQPILECWTTLSYLAARYERLKLGSLVLGQRYRNPALLAKMAATLQVLTDGRLVLGLGAGWHAEEHTAYGFGGLPAPADRVEQLTEVVTILRLMWEGGPATFHGRHYSIQEAYCQPVPATPIPLLIGSDGRRVVRLAAKRADAWNWDASPDLFYRPYSDLVQHLKAIGRPTTDIDITAGVNVHFPRHRSAFVESWPSGYPGYVEINHGPTPEEAIKSLRPFVDAHVSHFMVSAQDMRTLQLFNDVVAPALNGRQPPGPGG